MWRFFLKALGFKSFTETPTKTVSNTPTPGKPSPAAFRRMLLTVAREELAKHIREVTRNQHPELKKYWRATSYGIEGFNNREPWCAAFACWLVYEAARRIWGDSIPFPPCKSAGVINWPAWAKTAPGWKRLPPSTRIEPGDIVCWDFNGKASGGTHIGLATCEETGTRFTTIEGNTNSEGSREGDGLYAKTTRTRSGCIAVLRYVG